MNDAPSYELCKRSKCQTRNWILAVLRFEIESTFVAFNFEIRNVIEVLHPSVSKPLKVGLGLDLIIWG